MNDRILWIDVARGISILAMITFHFAFDLMYFGLAKSDLIYQPDWRLFERIIASSFLYIAGLSLFITHSSNINWKSFIRRYGATAVCAVLISIVTFILFKTDMIRFGILHAISVSGLIGLLLLKLNTASLILLTALIFAFNLLIQKPVEGHQYVMCCDVAKGRGIDFSTFSIFDVSSKPFKQVATFRNSLISPLLFPDLIAKYGKAYNDATVIIENNNEGSIVASQLHYDLEYPNVFVQGQLKAEDIGVTMSRKIKRIGCSTLKELLEEDRLQLLDRWTITELMTFVNKGRSFEADRGYHDDMVMTCVLFSWFVTTDYFYHLTNYQVKELLYSEQQKLIEEDMLPAGIFGDRTVEEESFVDNNGDRWFNDPLENIKL